MFYQKKMTTLQITIIAIIILFIIAFLAISFPLIAGTFHYISQKTGISYDDVNVIVYFIAIPFTWLFLGDLWLCRQGLWLFDVIPWVTIVIVGLFVLYIYFIGWRHFADTTAEIGFSLCKWTLNPVADSSKISIMGKGYVLASVILCVAAPMIITACLTVPLFLWKRWIIYTCLIVLAVCIIALSCVIYKWLKGDACALPLIHKLL
jgi:hypothetical protein